MENIAKLNFSNFNFCRMDEAYPRTRHHRAVLNSSNGRVPWAWESIYGIVKKSEKVSDIAHSTTNASPLFIHSVIIFSWVYCDTIFENTVKIQ